MFATCRCCLPHLARLSHEVVAACIHCEGRQVVALVGLHRRHLDAYVRRNVLLSLALISYQKLKVIPTGNDTYDESVLSSTTTEKINVFVSVQQTRQ